MIHKHTELEVKLDASEVSEFFFLSWIFSKEGCVKYIQVSGPDYFYKQGDNVVRVRVPPDEPIQLTIKKRRSQQSIRDRLEVELEMLPESTSLEDVDAFLQTCGFEKDISLEKRAHIFWFEKGKQKMVVSYYIATCNNECKSFIEVEVAKESEVTVDTGKGYLKRWVDEINQQFKSELQPLNQSLYEYFKNRGSKK